MVYQSVCDQWMTELTTHISDLGDATQHLYASWSSAAVADSAPGLHIAVWPEGDPDVATQYATDGTDEVVTSYQVQVWQGATAEATRVYDDDDANRAWLALYEAVKARFYLRANLGLGDTGSKVHYEGGKFDTLGDKRVFAIRFTKRRFETFS